jgi:hypothetical protein
MLPLEGTLLEKRIPSVTDVRDSVLTGGAKLASRLWRRPPGGRASSGVRGGTCTACTAPLVLALRAAESARPAHAPPDRLDQPRHVFDVELFVTHR